MSDSSVNWDAYLEVASISDVGMRRSSNQDSLAVSMASNIDRWEKLGHLFLVADGMGAHAAGELASSIAAEQIPHLYSKRKEQSAPEALRLAVMDANAEIHRKGQANEDFYNMGTTCSVLTLLPQGAVIAHIGDSRIYRLRDNQLEQLTFDHSLVWEMRASGAWKTDEEAANLVPKNVITRSLGPYPDVKVDLEGPFPIQIGDVFLICSDGLTGQVDDAELGPVLANLSPSEGVKVLADLGNLRGGPDNITAIIVKVTSERLTTANGRPLASPRPGLRVHALELALLVGCALLAVIFWFFNAFVTAAIPAAVALVILVWVVARAFGATGPAPRVHQHQLGKGPYTRTNCASGKQLIIQLEKITGELMKAAREEQWPIDWEKMDSLIMRAHKSAQHGQQAESIQWYARSISFLMDELRR